MPAMDEAESERHLGRAVARLVGGQAGVHACMSGLRMAMPLLALRQGHGAAAAGLLVALFGVAQVLASIPAGRLADRHGLRRPMTIGIVAAFSGALRPRPCTRLCALRLCSPARRSRWW